MQVALELIDGTLKADGTLELDQRPTLAPGRVKIALQPAQAGTARRSLAGVIDDIHHSQQARGFVGRTADEIDAGLREGEDAYEQKVNALRSAVEPTSPRSDG